MIPDFLCDADRFRLTRQRHLNALAWKPQGWIPLGITVNDPANTRGLTYDRWLEAEPFFEVQAKILRDTLAVGSDCMPVLPVNHLGDVLIPSMFGAELYVPKAMADSLQNQGATPLTLFDRIEQTDGLEVPAMSEGMMPQFERIVRTWHQLAPAWVDVITEAIKAEESGYVSSIE